MLKIRLKESIKSDSPGICVCDIDDTLLRSDPKDIAIIKVYPDGKKEKISTDQFAKDLDKGKPGFDFDISEFKDPIKVRNSIINGTPMINNLKIVKKYIDDGYDFAFLTARSAEEPIKDVMKSFLSKNLPEAEDVFKEGLSYAVTDEKYCEILGDMSHFNRKAYFLEKLCNMYDHVVFIDDDEKNLAAVHDLNIENLTILKAGTN